MNGQPSTLWLGRSIKMMQWERIENRCPTNGEQQCQNNIPIHYGNDCGCCIMQGTSFTIMCVLLLATLSLQYQNEHLSSMAHCYIFNWLEAKNTQNYCTRYCTSHAFLWNIGSSGPVLRITYIQYASMHWVLNVWARFLDHHFYATVKSVGATLGQTHKNQVHMWLCEKFFNFVRDGGDMARFKILITFCTMP